MLHTDLVPASVSGLGPLSPGWVGAWWPGTVYCMLYCTVLYWWPGFLVTALGSALAGLAILAFPATLSRHQQQQRAPASSSSGLGGTVAATLANPLYLLVRYCVLYTVLYCTVLCTGQPRRGQRQPPDRRPRSLPAQVRGDTVPAVRRSAEQSFIGSTILKY